MQLDGKMKPPKVPLMARSNTNDTMTIIGASSGMKGPIMRLQSQFPSLCKDQNWPSSRMLLTAATSQKSIC
jgi:hypothetical protein